MKMQTINSKKHKEKLLRIIMSDDEQEPEFQVFMQGLKYLQENEDNELVTTIIRSIENQKLHIFHLKMKKKQWEISII